MKNQPAAVAKDLTPVISVPQKYIPPTGIEYTKDDVYINDQGQKILKATGLQKKALEIGIAIDNIVIDKIEDKSIVIPGIGEVILPTFTAKVVGRRLDSGLPIIDIKHIDYYSRFQKYMAKKIFAKNIKEWKTTSTGKKYPVFKEEKDLTLTEWEKFEIGQQILEEKDYGLEKTVTGSIDRVIRKLIGDMKWIEPGEQRLLDEEFNEIQKQLIITQKNGGYKKHTSPSNKIRPKASQEAKGFIPEEEPEPEMPSLEEVISGVDISEELVEPEPTPKEKEKTTTNFKFLEVMKEMKEKVGEEDYYTCLRNFGYEKSNQITKREEQEIVYRALKVLEEKKNPQNRDALWKEFQIALSLAIANGYSQEEELNYCVSNYYPINTFEELKDEELRKEIKRLNKIKVNKNNEVK